MKRLSILLAALAVCPILLAVEFPQILPPPPKAPLSDEQESALASRLAELGKAFEAVKKHERSADAAIFLKAVRYALEFDEWYDKKADDGVKKATALLDEAEKRIASLKKNATPWMGGAGWKVLGFYSDIDDSPQPYAVEVPEGLEWGAGRKPVPMWVWLHGRGDTSTDLHFIAGKLNGKKPGQFQPAGTIVIHPFGRYCNGWKSAGETDVFEARNDAVKRFNVDQDRIALAGFSMGGAGAWHIGAHFADQWACVHAGAGFVDVKRYQKITPEQMPPWYEEKLWGVYDVPVAARNFFNVPLVAYSGEEDKQRDGAEYMQETLAAEGFELKHYIGPGMGHKYHPEVIKEVQAEIEKAVAKGRDPSSARMDFSYQTRTLQYPIGVSDMVEVLGLEEHWLDTRLESRFDPETRILTITTRNIAELRVDPLLMAPPVQVSKLVIDGWDAGSMNAQTFHLKWWLVHKVDGKWQRGMRESNGHPIKTVSLTGPIDDAFLDSFVIVLPDGVSANGGFEAWVRGESAHFIRRWKSLMRGDPRVKLASEVNQADMERSHLILWGDPDSNSLIREMVEHMPVKWNSSSIQVGREIASSAHHALVAIYPNQVADPSVSRYVVINSGLTFREAHDRTNSLQNPKLPDWAILDITVPADGERAGKVVAADFFDEQWQVKKDR